MSNSKLTFCRICEAACGVVVTEADRAPDDGLTGKPFDRRIQICPDRDHPISQGFVCAKGTRFGEVARHPDRLMEPMRRRANGTLEPISWRAAMRHVRERIAPIIREHGPHSVAVYIGNPLAFNASGLLAMFGLVHGLGTRNVYGSGSQDCNNKFAGSRLLHGSAFVHPIPDIDNTELAVMFGTNPAVSQSSFVHLSGGSTAFDRLIKRGGDVIWVDPRRTESAERWGRHLPVRPGSDIFLILGLLRLAQARRPGWNRDHVEGLDQLLGLAGEFSPERVEALTGVPSQRLNDLADEVSSGGPVAFHMSVGVNIGPFGTLAYVALQALAFVTGNLDRKGGSLFHPMATTLGKLAKRGGVGEPRHHSRIGGFTATLETLPAGILADEITTPGPDQIRALIVVAGNPLHSVPGGDRLADAFARLDALVCVDMFENATGRAADVLLPATTWLERSDIAATGLVLQNEKLLQWTPQILPAPGKTRSEVRILADLSAAMRRPIFKSRIVSVFLRRFPMHSTISPFSLLQRAFGWLAPRANNLKYGIPWPGPTPGDYLGKRVLTPGHRLRFWHPDLNTEPARLRRFAEATVTPVKDGSRTQFQLLGRRRRIGHNSWLHKAQHDGAPDESAWLSHTDMNALGVARGDSITLRIRGSELTLNARAHKSVQAGTIVVAHGLPGLNVNALIPSDIDAIEPVSGNLLMTGLSVDVIPCAVERSAAPVA